jgi:hypothetical protein
MSIRNLLFDFAARSSVWGAGIGFFLGIIYFLFYGLWAYGIWGLGINLIVGWVLGLLNGFMLGFLYSMAGNTKPARLNSFICSILVTFIASFIMYFLVFSPLGRERTIIVIFPLVIITTLIAAFLSQRVFTWYSKFENSN